MKSDTSEPNTTESRRPSSSDTSESVASAVAPWSLSMSLAATPAASDQTASELKLIRKELSKIAELLNQTVMALWEVAAASDGLEDEIETSESTYIDGTPR